MKLLDANVLLRYLLGEPREQAEEARAAIEAGAFTTMEVFAEVVYVLQKVYGISRGELGEAVLAAAGELRFEDYDVLAFALKLYRQHALDFVDCVLAARALVQGEEVFSFDKKLMNLIEALRSGENQS